MSVTFLSSITVTGFPTEVYLFGAVTLWMGIALVVPLFFAYAYYIPMFHRLKLQSIYEASCDKSYNLLFMSLSIHKRL